MRIYRLACLTVAEQTHSSIVIASDPGSIMDVIADVEAYPEWTSGLTKVTADEVAEDGRPLAATFQGSLGGVMKGFYSVAYDWSPTEVSWHYTAGDALKDLHGSYACTDRGDGTTQVDYRLEIELAIPIVGMLRRRGEKAVVDSALKGLKRRVEG